MKTTELRKAIKAVDPKARVSTWGTGSWTIRTENKLDEIRAALAPLGLEEQQHDVEGSRWDWTYVLIVALPAAKKSPKKSPKQLDAEIAHALGKSSAASLASEPDEWSEIDDEYAGTVQSLIDDGYTRDEARASAEDNIRETHDDEVVLWRPKHERRAKEALRKA